MNRRDDAPTRAARSRRGSWQQPVMTLGALLILAALLLPPVGLLVRARVGEEADAAFTEFRKAAAVASDAHGPLLAAMSALDVETATEQLTRLAQDRPAATMKRYLDLQSRYEGIITSQGRTDLQPTLDAAREAYADAEKAQRFAQHMHDEHEATFGRFLRYAGLAGSVGLVLLIWTALTGIGRRARL